MENRSDKMKEISNKLTMRVLASTYEYYLEVGEKEYLETVSKLGEEIKKNWPLLTKKLEDEGIFKKEA